MINMNNPSPSPTEQIIEHIEGMKRKTNDDWKCKVCGWEGVECECVGYNKAIDEIITYLKSLK